MHGAVYRISRLHRNASDYGRSHLQPELQTDLITGAMAIFSAERAEAAFSGRRAQLSLQRTAMGGAKWPTTNPAGRQRSSVYFGPRPS
jgi:hypothetical protein